MKEITLGDGHVAIVDDEDFPGLSQHRWQCKDVSDEGEPARFYAYRHQYSDGKRHPVHMHRLILCAPDGMLVDHVNGDGLDNRRMNLRLCTRRQNSQNWRPERRSNATGFFGVQRNASGRFTAYVYHNDRRVSLGTFDSAIEAARFRDVAVIAFYGEYGFLNFPDDDELQNINSPLNEIVWRRWPLRPVTDRVPTKWHVVPDDEQGNALCGARQRRNPLRPQRDGQGDKRGIDDPPPDKRCHLCNVSLRNLSLVFAAQFTRKPVTV